MGVQMDQVELVFQVRPTDSLLLSLSLSLFLFSLLNSLSLLYSLSPYHSLFISLFSLPLSLFSVNAKFMGVQMDQVELVFQVRPTDSLLLSLSLSICFSFSLSPLHSKIDLT